MKSTVLLGILTLVLPVLVNATSITFDNRTSLNPSAIRLHIGSGGAGACSTSPMVQHMTGNEGMTRPHQRNVAELSPQVEAVLCKNNTCRADLYMNEDCSGDPLTTVTLPLGGMATVSPETAGDYRFVGVVNGVVMTCADGTDNC